MKLDDFKLKHRMTVLQVRKSRELLNDILDLVGQAKNTDNEELLDMISSELVQKMNQRTKQQDELIEETLEDCLDLEKTPLVNIEYLDMLNLYSELYIKSTQVEKKQPPASTISS